jgi:hypothetical protein
MEPFPAVCFKTSPETGQRSLGSLHKRKGMRGPFKPSLGVKSTTSFFWLEWGCCGSRPSTGVIRRNPLLRGFQSASFARWPFDLLTSHFSRNSPCDSRVSLVALACGMDSAVPAGLGFSSISKPRTDVLGYVQVVPAGLDQGRQKPTRLFIGSAIIRSPIRGGD